MLTRIRRQPLLTGAFRDSQQWRFSSERPCTRDEWLDPVPTFGGNAQFPSSRLEELPTGIGAAAPGGGM
jgi:hypothetical protein